MASSSSITPSSMKKDRGDEEQDSSSSFITPSSMEKYDVFLCSTGEDTRHSFTRHLCDVLRANKISTFTYDRLQRGDLMSKGIHNAIERSRISVIIFSKGYASSRWCLYELVQIIECRKKYNQIVIPVYYDIELSQVRNQTGPFAAAFKNHKARFARFVDSVDLVQIWRDALRQVANVAGFNLSEFKSEAELTQVIVNDILKKLGRWSIGGILKRYRFHQDRKELYDDIVNFIKRHYSGHIDEKALHNDIVNNGRLYKGEDELHDDIVNIIIKRISSHKDEDEDTSSCNITAEWIFAITNLILEVPSFVFDQLSSVHKPQYALVSMLLSFTALFICIIQLAYQGGKARVGWRWRPKKIPWFYYPPPGDKPFGTVTDFIGLLCAICQSIFTTIDYALYLQNINDPIKISIWPLVFSFCLMCSTFFKESPKKVAAFCLLCSTFFKESPKEEASTESTAPVEDNV